MYMGMPSAECLRRPACSVCLAAVGNRWKLSMCIITLLCRGSLTSVARLYIYIYVYICIYICIYMARLPKPLSWKTVFVFDNS